MLTGWGLGGWLTGAEGPQEVGRPGGMGRSRGRLAGWGGEGPWEVGRPGRGAVADLLAEGRGRGR